MTTSTAWVDALAAYTATPNSTTRVALQAATDALTGLAPVSARLADTVPAVTGFLADQKALMTTPADGGVGGDGHVVVQGADGSNVTLPSYPTIAAAAAAPGSVDVAATQVSPNVSVFPTPRTLAERLSQDTFVAGEDFGMTVDGSTDDAPKIQALIDAFAERGRGGVIRMPPKGVSKLGSGLVISTNNILIQGPGCTSNQNAGAASELFSFLCATGITALTHCTLPQTPSAPGARGKTRGGGFADLNVMGAATALHIVSVYGGDYAVYSGPVTGDQMFKLETLPDLRSGSGAAKLGEASDNSWFKRLFLLGRAFNASLGDGGSNASAHGVVMAGESTGLSGNCCYLHNVWIDIAMGHGTALLLQSADNCTMHMRSQVFGTGSNARVSSSRPGGFYVEDLDLTYSSNANTYVEGTEVAGTTGVYKNTFRPDLANSSPIPTLGTGVKMRLKHPKLDMGLSAVRGVFAGDLYNLALAEAAAGATIPLYVKDVGQGALALDTGGGQAIFGDAGSGYLRIYLQGLLTRLLLTGGLKVKGGFSFKPTEGEFLGLEETGQVCIDITGTGTTRALRFYMRDTDGHLYGAGLTLNRQD